MQSECNKDFLNYNIIEFDLKESNVSVYNSDYNFLPVEDYFIYEKITLFENIIEQIVKDLILDFKDEGCAEYKFRSEKKNNPKG